MTNSCSTKSRGYFARLSKITDLLLNPLKKKSQFSTVFSKVASPTKDFFKVFFLVKVGQFVNYISIYLADEYLVYQS